MWIKIKIEQYKLLYFQNDEPCPYRTKDGYELMINPVKVKDWSIFESSLDVLKIDKNSINNIDIIKMSYLDFLCSIVIPNDRISGTKLANVFYYSMGYENIQFINLK